MWNPKDWNWTPNLGWWFVDAGAFVGAGHGQVNFGVAGSAKFGILFKKVPIRLAVDVTPKIGLYAYNGGIHFWAQVCSTAVLLQHIASNLERKIGLCGSLRQEDPKVFPSGKVSEGNAFVREYIGVLLLKYP